MTIKIVTLKNLYGGIVNLDEVDGDRGKAIRRMISYALAKTNLTHSIIDRGSHFFLGEDNRIYLLANLNNQPRLYRVITSHKDWLTPKDVKSISDHPHFPAGTDLYFYRGGAGCLLDKSRHVIRGILLDNQTEPHWFTEAKLIQMFTP
jgi:hypothetical protein